MIDKYKLIGASYDRLSKLYSGNAIQACKLSMLRTDTLISSEQGATPRVLFAGAGHGTDAIHAAELGADVTVVDISPTMMKHFQKRLDSTPEQSQLSIETLQQDILKVEDYSAFDLVVANFFLDVFDEDKMKTLLVHLGKLLKPKGQFIIGDFCPPDGSLPLKTVHNLYWYTAATAFFTVAGNAIHQIYDYEPLLEKENFEVIEKQYFRFLRRNMYYSLRAIKR